jgi:hypothetical protein
MRVAASHASVIDADLGATIAVQRVFSWRYVKAVQMLIVPTEGPFGVPNGVE